MVALVVGQSGRYIGQALVGAALSGGAAAPVITDVDTDEIVTANQQNVVITGTDFDTATVAVRDGSLSVAASIDSQNATTITADLGGVGTTTGIRYGSRVLRVTNGDAQFDDQAITLNPPSGVNYVDLSTLAPGTDTNAYALAQTYTASTPLTLEAGAAAIDPPRRVSFTADSDESATSFTIVGDDENGNPDSEVVVGPNNTTVYSDGYWSSITSITPNATEAVDQIEVGAESLRLETSPDMASGDQLEWSNVVGGTIGDVTVNNDGTFTAAAGVTAFDIRVHNQTEGWGSIATQDISDVGTAPTITTTTLPDADRTQAYSQTLAATGDTPISWDLSAGVLPTGLSLNVSTGEISGTPTVAGDETFTVEAINDFGSDLQELTITVLPVIPSITTTTLPDGYVAIAYSQQIAYDGDAGTADISAGALPAGLSISSGGLISGTPTTEETANFTVRITNDKGNDTQALTIVIGPTPVSAGDGRGGRRRPGRGFLKLTGR